MATVRTGLVGIAWVALAGCAPTAPIASVAPPAPPESVEAWLLDADAAALEARPPAEVRAAVLARIAALEPVLSATIAVDPSAFDRGRGEGPLANLPILVKDNVDAVGFATTAGSRVMAGNVPPDDAFLVARLREAGAIVLGKTNLSEWANFRSDPSSSGWSGAGGQARNPHALDRSPCGSSSGSAIAVAAGYVPFAIATETDGSILCPASINGIVGVKPTLGLVSRDGIVPIAHSQDTAGPVARTVRDAARLLEVIAAADPSDPASAARPADLDLRYVDALDPDALRGARIGAVRGLDAFSPAVDALFDRAIADLRRLGAEVVEVELPVPDSAGDDETEVLLHEFRPDLERYLAGAPASVPKTLAALIDAHRADPLEVEWFGLELFEQAAAHAADGQPDDYATAAARLKALGPAIDAALGSAALGALIAPSFGPAWPIDPVGGDAFTGGTSTITAVSGYPAVTVPMGDVHGLPVGVSWIGPAWSEARLLGFAYAYEQGTGTPTGTATAGRAPKPTFRQTVH
ncbi:MAG: amidase [Myxococcota bacterium]